MPKSYALIGGGLVGLATALQLRRLLPNSPIRLFEKEANVGQHQSTHNSGVLHAGLYYKPGSLKARLAVRGIREMKAFCEQQNVRYETCGKTVVASDESEIPRLRTLLERGQQNGLTGLRWLAANELNDIEPHAAGVAAVHVPEEGIVDYAGVCAAMMRCLRNNGVDVLLSAQVLGIHKTRAGWTIISVRGEFPADFIVNCAGLHCDRIAHLAGMTQLPRIIPFRGEYYRLRADAAHLVRNLIYPVPDPTFPFLGVHFTRLIHGGIEAGPNAVLAFAREGYSRWQVNMPDLADAALYPGVWRFMRRHAAMTWGELRRSFSRRLFCNALRKLVPAIEETDLEAGGSGVRAQAMLADGTLVQDFHLLEGPNALHVLNAPSPAATASLAIGAYVAEKAQRIASA